VVWAADLDGGRLRQDPSRDDMRYIQVDEARDKALVLYRCLSGSVAVSAYELAALPLPTPETLDEWAQLSGRDLPAAVDAGYGLASDGIKVRNGLAAGPARGRARGA
jgi:hypothetical protein